MDTAVLRSLLLQSIIVDLGAPGRRVMGCGSHGMRSRDVVSQDYSKAGSFATEFES